MKAIIFDVDGVIIKSDDAKGRIISDVLKKHDLYELEGVEEILSLMLNRVIVLDMISELVDFDKEAVLAEINREMDILEQNPVSNTQVIEFIKANYKEYAFFTNTSLPQRGLQNVFKGLGITHCFKELLAYEEGSKVENTQYVIDTYNLDPSDILFIDDTLIHIDRVKQTLVHTLHFNDFDIDIEEYIESLL